MSPTFRDSVQTNTPPHPVSLVSIGLVVMTFLAEQLQILIPVRATLSKGLDMIHDPGPYSDPTGPAAVPIALTDSLSDHIPCPSGEVVNPDCVSSRSYTGLLLGRQRSVTDRHAERTLPLQPGRFPFRVLPTVIQ